ncbi:MAG TPA: ABC-type transport auxiliary lipoprotein family protein [Candidatus Udaeobacter sp.]|nr:ABC-type transport auxiliary lipoprotein family protein [Candidatus Udaeobacter sp.]
MCKCRPSSTRCGPRTSSPPTCRRSRWQLVVELPTAAAGIDTSRIALSHDPFILEYFAKAAWTDNATGMIQTLLVESFERTRKIVAVGPESAGLRPDYILKTDLRAFEADYRGTDPIPTAVVRMSAKLVAMPQRRIIGAVTSQKYVKAAGSRFEDILNAFNDALGHVLRDVVVFTLTTPPAA